MALSVWGGLPWPGIAALGGLGASALAADLQLGPGGRRFWKGAAPVAGWTCTLLAPLSFVVLRHPALTFSLGSGFAGIAWLMAAALLPAALNTAGGSGIANWRVLTMAWAVLGSLLLLSGAYLHDHRGAFYAGLFINVALLVLSKRWFKMPAWLILSVNTLILLAVSLPLANLLVYPARHPTIRLEPGKRYYWYEEARNNAPAFKCWWNHFQDEWTRLQKELCVFERTNRFRYSLRPGATGMLSQSKVRINSLGFRGKEIRQPKGETYRIVALGESTTFGATLNTEDRPWPELLEDMIQNRLKPDRPVEVINAGVPGYSIEHNLRRLPTGILPLKPDMLICYHGINGFPLLDRALPSLSEVNPPRYIERPLNLLANAEYGLRLTRFNRRRSSNLALHPPTFNNLMETEYAEDYRQLIQAAATNGIRLVVGNFSLAVNRHSEPDVIEFYGTMMPDVRWYIRANEAHASLVSQLAQQYPNILVVDTHPHLDGEHTKFIDAMHLSQEGRQQLAETWFAAIKPLLERELHPAAHPMRSSPARVR